MGSDSTRAKKHFFFFIAGLGLYKRQSTDTAGNGTSVDKSKPLEKGGWAELDRKVDLRAAAW